MSQRDNGIFSRGNFVFDANRNFYTCPQGKPLRTTGRIHASRKTETRSDISWMQMGLQQAAIDDRQIGPDAPELVGVLNAGGFPPLR